jgi:2-keto-4-pentenoate hydratase/2-oxohepta-3-ene-1,7-dioic acid hydratase in catechol pathway
LPDWQSHRHPFIAGMNFPTTAPLGPCLVTPDEVGTLGPKRIETRLAGEVVQSATFGDMIFSIPRVISYISDFTPLCAGDVVALGTPGGSDFTRDPRRYMRAGEIVEISIEGVGILRNPIASEALNG